jgi:pyruvate,orthophosphate dikinase
VLGVDEDQGVAVIVSSMVYGNLSVNSGTGFMESRSSVDGNKELQVEFLSAAEGEDVIVSRHTPVNAAYLKATNTSLYKQLEDIAYMLEKQFRDSVSVEFALQDSRLAVLQVRCGVDQRTTPVATLQILKDLVDEGVITEREAVGRVPPKQIQWFTQDMHKVHHAGNTTSGVPTGTSIDAAVAADVKMLGIGKAINYGTVIGRLAFNTADVRTIGDDAIFVTHTFDPLLHTNAIKLARGVVLLDDGVSSTAALIVRGLGKPAICGCTNMETLNKNGTGCTLVVDGEETNLTAGSPVSLNASAATLYKGHIEVRNKPRTYTRALVITPF